MNILQLTPNGWAKDEVLVDNIMEAMDTTEQQDFVVYRQCAGTWRLPGGAAD